MENSDFRTSTRLGHQSQASTVAILPSEPPPPFHLENLWPFSSTEGHWDLSIGYISGSYAFRV